MAPSWAILSAVVALVAGCGSDASDEAAELSVIGADELAFEPAGFEIPAGEEVTLTFSAESGVEHDFVVEEAADVGVVEANEAAHGGHEDDDGMEGGDLHVAHADPGQTTTATFQIDEPDTYEVYCSVPGHRDAGMVATLTVVDGS